MSNKKIIQLLLCLFLLVFKTQAQTTYDFSSPASLTNTGTWITQADITINGVAYRINAGGNGDLSNQATGGSSGTKCLRKDGSGGDFFTIRRLDNQPFQFYGIWVSHKSMNSYIQFYTLPSWYTLGTSGVDSFLYDDMTPMTPGTSYNNFTSSETAISTGAGGKKVSSVTISFKAMIFYSIDNIIVGPAASTNPAIPVITGNPLNKTICANKNTAFSISSTTGTSYQWYQNSGSGFTALTNVAPFSGVTTTTLNVTGATGAMNGNQYHCVVSNSSGSVTSNSANLTVTSVSATTTKTNPTCNGYNDGTATVTASGGTGPYSYSWSPSGGTAATASGLSVGVYTVTVTDNLGCSTTANATITQPAALVATMNTTKVTCPGRNDGKAYVQVSGGVAPYTYSWNNGSNSNQIIDLSEGIYEVTITDSKGCKLIKQVFVDTTVDITAPIPAVATLPVITKECSVKATDFTVPKATDNCAGVITATTTDALVYTQQGTYTINWTYDDGNGNTTTQLQTVIVDDVTAPIPAVATLPVITKECSVIATDIAVPTATDNCSGVITATTTDALVYTEQGTYTINWTYDDGNGNTTIQQQTVIVEESPLAKIVLNDFTTVYNGNIHQLWVDNLPAGATVSYSINPQAEESNGAINAGTYIVTAVVTPPASAVNCEAVTLTAELVIEKATQTILFNELEVVLLEEAADFQLTAEVSSGLPLNYTYTYNQTTPAALVSAQGWVELKHSGSVLIAAHQEGNSNYLPAVSVERTLVIESRDASIQQVVINGKVYNNPDETIYYMLDCDALNNEVSVQIDAEYGAAVSPSRDFVIVTPKPGVYRNTVEVV